MTYSQPDPWNTIWLAPSGSRGGGSGAAGAGAAPAAPAAAAPAAAAPAAAAPAAAAPALPLGRLEETLLSPSQIRLFGRVLTDLQINRDSLEANFGDEPGASPFQNPLTDKLRARHEPRLARIYGFSYEGNYFKMASPAIFLVHGAGFEVATLFDANTLAELGVEFKSQNFSIGVRMWSYDRSDMSIRLDVLSGELKDILLAPEFAATASVTGGDVAPRNDYIGRAVDLVGRDSNAIGPGWAGRGRSR